MAIAKVQSTPSVFNDTGLTQLTFSVTPTSGNIIVIPIISFRQSAGQTPTVTDNQTGNTYHVAANSGNDNGSNAFIYYAYNINATGTFTVSIAMAPTNTQVFANAIEFSGFGGVDPLVGSGTGANSCTTGTTGAPEVAVVACMALFRLNFNITGITVNSTSPAWFEEYEVLQTIPLAIAGEADSKVVSGGGAQAVSWSITSGGPGNQRSCIAAFFGTPPIADVINYQTSRSVLELEDSGIINCFQISRQVMYPFTCTPGPPPPPPGVTGCVDELPDSTPSSEAGCIPEV